MDKYELHNAAMDMAQGTTQYELARELVKERERIGELEMRLMNVEQHVEIIEGYWDQAEMENAANGLSG